MFDLNRTGFRGNGITAKERAQKFIETGDRTWIPKGVAGRVDFHLPPEFRKRANSYVRAHWHPTAEELAKRKKLISEIRILLGDSRYNGISKLPSWAKGLRWHGVKRTRADN